MTVTIEKSRAEGTVQAPPSKSMAHRALICGALSDNSVIDNIAYSKDIEATLGCLENLGAKILKSEDNLLKIGGLDLHNTENGTVLFCNESGSTLRFLIPLCMVSGKKITLRGSKRLFERPLGIYEDICIEQGILFEKGESSLTVCGKLKNGEYSVRGDISSQFITGLLFALPLLDGDSILRVTEKFESASYIDLTLSVLEVFGIEIKREDNNFYIKGRQKYTSQNYTVEGDCSNAAFLEGLNLLGGNVSVKGIKQDTLQGDRVYLEMYEGLKNGKKNYDLSDCPDLAPVMFAVSAYFGGAEFFGTSRLKIKESDRASTMSEELEKFGVSVRVEENSVLIESSRLTNPREFLCGHNDHRIVMALALLCTVTGGTIEGAEAVSKSYPDFFDVLRAMKIKVRENEN